MAARIKNEPALLLGLVQAALAVAVSFGFSLSAEQMGGIVALCAAASAVFLRQRVTPVSGTAGDVAPIPAMISAEPVRDLVAAV